MYVWLFAHSTEFTKGSHNKRGAALSVLQKAATDLCMNIKGREHFINLHSPLAIFQ